MIWQEKSFDRDVFSLLKKSDVFSPLTAKLLSGRSISSVDEAKNFLSPKLAYLTDPFDIPQMNQSVDRIKSALANKEEILLIGDYDADGISSVSIVQKVLSELGGNSSYVIPKRLMKAMDLLKKFLREDLKNKSAIA